MGAARCGAGDLTSDWRLETSDSHMFVDEVDIHVAAGHGGRGALSFRREKFIPRGGPDGGNGGPGGSVYLVANANLNTLLSFRFQKLFEAGRGGDGEGSNRSGKKGSDIELRVPTGTVVYEKREGDAIVPLADLTEDGQRVLIAQGGLGGHGNAAYATSTNRAPRKTQPGLPGEERDLRLHLKLLADVGLVGYPNAGKSTMIARISAARPEDRRLSVHDARPQPRRGSAVGRALVCRGGRSRVDRRGPLGPRIGPSFPEPPRANQGACPSGGHLVNVGARSRQ